MMPYVVPGTLTKRYNVHFIVPTKGPTVTKTKQGLFNYVKQLQKCNLGEGIVDIKFVVGCNSIFKAYSDAVLSIIGDKEPSDEDIFIFCHDDIDIHTKPETFIEILSKYTQKTLTGFVGVAGTKELTNSAIWWDQSVWVKGGHSGFVLHSEDLRYTYYGPNERVVVLDGLFLACSYRTLKQINLNKPPYFEGEWDFYDLYYTLQAHKLGLCNLTVPIVVNHISMGELVGRDSWHKNRLAFIQNNHLPVKI